MRVMTYALALSDLSPTLQQRWETARYHVDAMLAGLGTPAQINHPDVFRLKWRMVRLMRDWLGHAEALLRRVLFLTALALKLDPPTDKPVSPRKTKTTSEPPPYIETDPASWRVSFKLTIDPYIRESARGASKRWKPPYAQSLDDWPPYEIWKPERDERLDDANYAAFIEPKRRAPLVFLTAAQVRAARDPHAIPKPLLRGDPRPLAVRLEAILRVIDNPMAYAMRLALRLKKKRQRPRLIVGILRLPAQSNLDRWHEIITPLQEECVEALLEDTS